MRVRRPCRTKERPVTVLLAVRCSGGGCTARRPIASAHSTAGRTPAYLRASPGAQHSRPLSHRQQVRTATLVPKFVGPKFSGPRNTFNMAQEQRKRRLLWVAGTVAAAGAGAYLLYRAW